jgi:hypothetical protein
VKETLLKMDRVDVELADRQKKLKKSGSIAREVNVYISFC